MECLHFTNNEFIGLYCNKNDKIIRKISISKNFIEIDDFFNGDHIENYALLENNLNVSSSFEALDRYLISYEIF